MKEIIINLINKNISCTEEQKSNLANSINNILESQNKIHWRDTLLDIQFMLNKLDDVFIEAGTDYIENQ